MDWGLARAIGARRRARPALRASASGDARRGASAPRPRRLPARHDGRRGARHAVLHAARAGAGPRSPSSGRARTCTRSARCSTTCSGDECRTCRPARASEPRGARPAPGRGRRARSRAAPRPARRAGRDLRAGDGARRAGPLPGHGDMAEDLRAFLERRVVRAYETGAWAEAKKWVQRNKALAAARAVAVLLLIAGLTASLVFKAHSDENARIATANEVRATEQEQLALRRAAELAEATKTAQEKEASRDPEGQRRAVAVGHRGPEGTRGSRRRAVAGGSAEPAAVRGVALRCTDLDRRAA